MNDIFTIHTLKQDPRTNLKSSGQKSSLYFAASLQYFFNNISASLRDSLNNCIQLIEPEKLVAGGEDMVVPIANAVWFHDVIQSFPSKSKYLA